MSVRMSALMSTHMSMGGEQHGDPGHRSDFDVVALDDLHQSTRF